MSAVPNGGRRRRVLHVNRVAHMGGVERVLLTLAAGTRRLGYDPALACPPEGELPAAARHRGIEVVDLPIDRTPITADPRILARCAAAWAKGSRRLVGHCRDAGVDILHVHHPVGALYAGRASRTLGIPLLLHVHEVGPGRAMYRAALRAAARNVDQFVAVCEPSLRLLADVGIPSARVAIVHNGVDPGIAADRSLAADPDFDGPGPHFGIFGVLEPRKGQDVFLRAAATLAESYPEARFWIVGGAALADKASHERVLLALADAPKLMGRVRFTGHRPDVAALMRRMDVVILASVADEALPTVLLEAATLARPVVASSIGGVGEIVRDGETGRLVPPGRPDLLAAAMAASLGPDGRRMGRAAAADAKRRFSSEAFSGHFTAIYDKLVRRRADARAGA